MACFSPKFAFTFKSQYLHGERRPRFDLHNFPDIKRAIERYHEHNPDWLPLQAFAPPGVWLHRISCGQCLACRMSRSREWADRSCMEALQYDSMSNWFVTLTFDDDHLVYNELPLILSGGELIPEHLIDLDLLASGHYDVKFVQGDLATVHMDDVSMFMKRLRSRMKSERGHDGIKFFACAEYGDKSLRPHYHILVFNCPLHPNELKRSKLWKPGTAMLYDVDLFSDCWHDGSKRGGKDGNLIGNVVVGRFCYNTAAYVARYITKKQLGKGASIAYDRHGIDPVSMRCSLRPGIGSQFMRDNWLELSEKGIYLPTDNPDKPLQVHMPHRMYQSLCSPDFVCNTFTGEVYYPGERGYMSPHGQVLHTHSGFDRMYELMFIKCDQDEKRELVRDTMKQQLTCSEEEYLCHVLPIQLEARQKQAMNRGRFC